MTREEMQAKAEWIGQNIDIFGPDDIQGECMALAEDYATSKAIGQLKKAKETAWKRNERKDSRGFRSMMNYFDQAIAALKGSEQPASPPHGRTEAR